MAPDVYARVRNLAQGWTRMDSEKIGRLIAAWRPMPMHMCGIWPWAGNEWTAKKIGRLIAAWRPMPMRMCGIDPGLEANGQRKKTSTG